MIPLLFLGCVENFDPEINPDFTDLVYVDGIITNSSPTQVTIGRTVKFGETSQGEFINDATVTILENGEVFEVLNQFGEGNYQGSKLGEIDQAYELEIILNDGKIIRSSPQTLISGPQVGDLSLDRIKRDLIGVNGGVRSVRGLNVNVYLNDETTKAQFFRWKLDATYKFISPLTLMECYVGYRYGSYFALGESTRIDKSLLSETIVFLEGTQEFVEGFSLEVTQYVLSRDSFNYWKQIDDQKNNSGSVFDPPPSPISGNLAYENSSSLALGFFSASFSSTKRIFIAPSAFEIEPYFSDALCYADDPSVIPEWCSDCTTLQYSTRIVPTYWCLTCE